MDKYHRNSVTFKQNVLEFQALDWLEFNENDFDDITEEEDFFGSPCTERYVIRAFGTTINKESVCVNIKNFTPFFYIKVESTWKKTDTSNFIEEILFTQSLSKKGNLWSSMKRYKDCFVPDKCITLKRYDYSGFTAHKEYTFLRLVFNNSIAMSTCIRLINDHNNEKCRIGNIKYRLKIYEGNLPGTLRFFHLRDIKPSGWLKVSNFKVENNIAKKSRCQIELSVDWKSIEKVERNTSAPFLQASFDIETFSGDLHSFPIPTNKEDKVITIATTFKWYNDSDFFVKHILTLKKSSAITESEGTPVVLECFDDEKDLLIAWRKLIVKMDPDVIYGYNSDSFDCWYLYKRAELLNCLDSFKEISRLKEHPCKYIEKTFASSGRGTTEFRRLEIIGRINFDILIFIKIEYKLTSYKLNDVSKLYVGDNKVDMNIKEMFKMFEKGDPDDIKLICDYCIQDTCLPQKLVDKLLIMQTQISMSNVTFVPIRYLIERGQQIKTFSLLVKFANSKNFLVPTLGTNTLKKNADNGDDSDDGDDERFTGAVVLTPKSDAYYDPICTLDFKSLYPSIMMAHSLCHSTLVKSDSYRDHENYNYSTYEWDDMIKDDKKKPILDENGEIQYVHHAYTYAVKKDLDDKIQGVLPKILEGLVNSRQEYKDLMKKAYKENNTDLANVYNTSQLAVKVTMNSIYGFLGAQMLPEKKIAATVTALGRQMINKTKNFLEDNYLGAEIVYGDSVTGDTPLLLKKVNNIYIETIESIFDENKKHDYSGFKAMDDFRTDKEYSSSGYQIWSKSGWVNIKRIIRHKCNKKIYQLNTGNSYVKVTEDHSLLNKNCEIIKPGDCDTNTILLTGYPSDISHNIQSDVSHGKAFICGFFFGVEYVRDTKKNIWCIEDENLDILKNIVINKYPEEFEYYKLVLDRFSAVRQKIVYKKVPNKIINADKKYIKSFFKGYSSVNGCRLYKGTFYCTVFGQVGCSGAYIILKKLGYNITNLETKKDTFYITASKNSFNFNLGKINSIETLGFIHDYVYDIETEDGTFQAGVGDIIVKNTDSCFVRFNTALQKKYAEECNRIDKLIVVTENDKDYLRDLKTRLIKETMELGKRAANEVTKSLFTYPISLEYEKVNMPCILLSKKRYIMNKYEDDPEKYKETSSGIILNRRDNFKLVKNLYRNIVNILLNMITKDSKDKTKITEIINKTITDILERKIDINELTITKTYKPVKKNENLPQLALVRKIMERDPGNAPRYNDKINYVIVDNDSIKAQPQYMKSESPEYALEHNLHYDAEYYITFIMKPICELLKFYFATPEDIFKIPLKAHKEKRKQKLKELEPKKETKRVTRVVQKTTKASGKKKVNRVAIKKITLLPRSESPVEQVTRVIRISGPNCEDN